MGTVFEAEDVVSGQRVAVKLIVPGFAPSEAAVRRFRQEGRLAATLAHPRCVFVLAADEEAGQPYIVMELMPGETLQDVVLRRGPLPIEQALAYTLDVIDGLREAHRLGIIHRDVKPSNCFLGTDGRVKVGDFGLAKAMAGDEQLTRKGEFLGTPLYASPEQIKKEPLDGRTDVYSVAATLYYLLTGRAPFESGDAAVSVARALSDPTPSVRRLRPEVRPGLDKVIMRGLAREPDRRWPDMEAFRAAILPFMPDQLTIADMGLRVGAYLIDNILVSVPAGVCVAVLIGLLPDSIRRMVKIDSSWVQFLLISFLVAAYFTVCEGLWGATLGKAALGLRVYPATGYGPPGLARALLRFLVFAISLEAVRVLLHFHDDSLPWLFLFGGYPGLVAIALPMRRRNGFRGLHEFLSGTRVVRLRSLGKQRPSPKRTPSRERGDRWRSQPGPRLAESLTCSDGLPARVGSFQVRGALEEAGAGTVLLAQDMALDREVVIWLRPPGANPLSPTRRSIERTGRLRWLASGSDGERQWDAFLAPAGRPLAEVVQSERRWHWPETRPVLEQLTEELVVACGDGTLPDPVAVDQVWVRPDGSIQLLDFPLPARPGSTADISAAWVACGADGNGSSDPQRALALLRQVATLALEGAVRPTEETPTPIRAAVPRHASKMLKRLLGVPQKPPRRHWWNLDFKNLLEIPLAIGHEPYGGPEQLQVDLVATADRPTQVSPSRRLVQLLRPDLAVYVCLLLGISYLVLQNISQLYKPPGAPFGRVNLDSRASIGNLVVVNLVPAGFLLGAFITRGHYFRPNFFARLIFLLRSDGRRPYRLQAACRALLVWAPVSALLSFAVLWAESFPHSPWVSWAAWGATIAYLLGCFAHAMRNPNCALHDRIVGTYLVPE
jgi:uncharacterized RDD family membrane protein YckC